MKKCKVCSRFKAPETRVSMTEYIRMYSIFKDGRDIGILDTSNDEAEDDEGFEIESEEPLTLVLHYGAKPIE